jgi:hypothetical protein
VPFLVVGVIELWDAFRSALPRPRPSRLVAVVRGVAITGLLLFVLAGVGTYDRIVNSNGVLVDQDEARAAGRAIDAHTRPGEVVIDFDPLDLYESHAQVFSGLESNFGTAAAANLGLTDREAARDKLVTIRRLEQAVRSRRIRTVVVGPYDYLQFPRRWTEILEKSGYKPVATVRGRTIWQLPAR